jgi:threonine aldolase
VQFTEVGDGGTFTAEELLAALKPRGHVIYPPTTLVEAENTHNRAGGVIFPAGELARIGAAAREHGVASYLDGARLLNAAVARGDEPAALAAPFDLVAISLSKGLGAPAGSVLAGSREAIDSLARYRRMLGGAMRQVGILAAAGSFALERNVERLAEDHANARLLAEGLARSSRVQLDLDQVETNIVVFRLADGAPDSENIVARAGERGVLVFPFGPRTIRAVTHLDVDADACRRAAETLVDIIDN